MPGDAAASALLIRIMYKLRISIKHIVSVPVAAVALSR